MYLAMLNGVQGYAPRDNKEIKRNVRIMISYLESCIRGEAHQADRHHEDTLLGNDADRKTGFQAKYTRF